jgi:exonuclease SbcD
LSDLPPNVGGVRFLHTSDWHLGRSFHRVGLLDAQRDFLHWLVAQAVERGVDAVLVPGDVFDRAVPPVEAVTIADEALTAFATAGIPVVITAGNHDSAARLGFGSGLARAAGVHVRTRLDELDVPVVLADEHGPVHVFALPYLDPDTCHEALGVARAHTAVMTAALDRVRARLAADPARSVVLAHAFVAGGAPSESERDIRVGGVADVPAAVFDGVDYVALGHLHGAQEVHGSTATVRYSGSPLRYSFGEAARTPSVTVVDLAADGAVTVELVPTPVPRAVASVSGRLADLLADPALEGLEDAWLQVTLTDDRRPDAALEQLRSRFPHTLVITFRPEGGEVDPSEDLARLRAARDPVEVGTAFLAYVAGEPTEAEIDVLRVAEERARSRQVEGLPGLRSMPTVPEPDTAASEDGSVGAA